LLVISFYGARLGDAPLTGLPLFWFDAVDVFQTSPGEIIDVR